MKHNYHLWKSMQSNNKANTYNQKDVTVAKFKTDKAHAPLALKPPSLEHHQNQM